MYPSFETRFVSNDVERGALPNSKSRTNSGSHKLQTASTRRISRMHFTYTWRSRNDLI